MFGRKFQIVTQIVGTITLAFLAVYGLLALIENGAAAWAQAPEVADVPSSAPSLESSEVSMSVPLVMNYQGDVKDAEGNALSGSYNMTFRIYADVVAGSALWEEQQQNVTVRAGHFCVLLGNTTPLPETLFDESDRFIGVTVDPYEEMVPRQRFASVPYAMHANYATNADHALKADHADRAFALDASDGNPQNALVVDNEGQVGIGTTPSEKLDVSGNIHVAGNIIATGNITTTGYMSVDGLRINNQKPFIFQNYTGLGTNLSYDTGYSGSEYVCGIVGFAALGGDINEFGPVNPILVYTYRDNGTWWIRADFATHCCSSENWSINMMCVDSDIAELITE